MIGVDPSRTMLEYARRQPGADSVIWIQGDASALAPAGTTDLSFESRNPAYREWERWTPEATYGERATR